MTDNTAEDDDARRLIRDIHTLLGEVNDQLYMRGIGMACMQSADPEAEGGDPAYLELLQVMKKVEALRTLLGNSIATEPAKLDPPAQQESAGEVTQADRDAAADFLVVDTGCAESDVRKIRQGMRDDDEIVEAFSQHRIQSTAALEAKLAKAREGLNRLRGGRSSVTECHTIAAATLKEIEP
ncbi:hypothetical protein M2336_001643 [Sphingobium sp. B1D7B]|uniref:hypothetical protein n=1 Tax=Sphingobium sp. B1D7B TaxID=2940578 RepID=UPI00222528E7|nr:hypothetical protein [Sphingobium sp. B1D7B]MCW2405014.1 hypothetical protein [Sphingobium sp. B1D7B]